MRSAGPSLPRKPRPWDLLLLLGSGLVVLAGAAAAQRSTVPTGATAAASAVGLPPPLPSGAPPRELEELPADDERAAGCHFADRGAGDYGDWRKLPLGRALVPPGRAVASDGSFRLLLHFHGSEPVRRQLAPEGFDLVIAALDAGIGSHAYDRALAEPAVFDRLVASVEAEVASAHHLPSARARSIVLSSWSAGYGAVAQVLARHDPRVDAVILLDSLYAGYTSSAEPRSLDRARIAPFLGAARAALAGGPALFLAHTEIATPGYGSTAEVASFLLAELGVSASPIEDDGTAYPLRRLFEGGHLWIRGYGGRDRDAHCAELHLLPGVLRELVLPVLR